ncbi:DNA translocase FtsK 4TM domain-containing protein [Maritalea sp.]|uniref:FtsK/SpoIIIE family DNA translocase n=1 Tax=Maritalea sp. TaxID=2003361 RepID=UPI003EF8B3C2
MAQETPTSIAVKIPLRLIGILCLVSIALIILSLMSWSANDPSLSYASNEVVNNWLGYPGAVVADLTFQFLGLAGLLFIIPPAIWSLTLIRKKVPLRFGLRSIMWIATTILFCGVLAFLPTPDTWPLPTGLGGIIGLGFSAMAGFVVGEEMRLAAGWIFALLLLTPAIVSLWLAVRAGTRFGLEPATSTELARNQDKNVQPKGIWAWFGSKLSAMFTILLGALTHLIFSTHVSIKKSWAQRSEQKQQEQTQPWRKGDAEPSLEPQISQTQHRADHQDAKQSRQRIEPQFESDMAHNAQNWVEGHFDENDQDFVDTPYDDYAPVADIDPATSPQPVSQTSVPQKPSPRVAAPAPRPVQGRRVVAEAQQSLLGTDEFELPELSYLAEPPSKKTEREHLPEVLEENARLLEGVLEDFGVRGDIINVRPGPVVTLYELEPAPGIKSSRVIGLADDIARSMSAISARVAVVPGRNAIGIELPNKTRETVYLREMLGSADFEKVKGKLPLCLGKTIGGEPVIADLARMPHLLIAGTTGSGKSVAINTFILSLLYRWPPEQCRMIMIDPKMLELSIYDGIPHLLTPVVTDPTKAVTALKWAVREMEDRYKKMSKIGVRNIDGFNQKVAESKQKGEIITRTVQTGFDKDTGEPIFESEEFDLEPLPFIVVIVDEMADLMMVAGKDIEGAIQRLAQMARAAGIHLIMATQRPSVDVITGTIKANFPTRISFQVTSKIDSRTILGEQGAEQLLGMGDMLYMAGGGRTKRLHGPFVADGEVETIVKHLKAQGSPEYLESVTVEEEEDGGETGTSNLSNSGDDLYDKAVNIVLDDRKASTSYIQRRLSIGYNRAATIIERMEQEGVISPANHAGKREILVGGENENPF